jgi:hypothetical protein
MPFVRERFQDVLWTWVAGGAVKLRLPIATALVVPLLTLRLSSLFLKLSGSSRHTPSTSLPLLPTVVGKPIVVLPSLPVFGPRPF